MRTKTIRAEVKAVETDNVNGEFEVILSAPTTDRDGEIIDAKAFEPLPDHITFDIDHGLSTATTVGSGTPFYDGDLLKVRGTFSSIPRAQEVRTLVTEGHIRTTSVAFMGAKKEVKDGIPHITKAELLNGAFVPVPSNREALVVSSKGRGKAGARNSASDQELIQGAHDNLVAAGASCDGEKAARLVRTKTMVGSFEERQEEMGEQLQAAYPDAWWVEIIATFDDRVVYEVHGGANDDMQFETPYAWDGAQITFGTAAPVDVSEVATPVAGAASRATRVAAIAARIAGAQMTPDEARKLDNPPAAPITITVGKTVSSEDVAAAIRSVSGQDATGADGNESDREDASGADGNDEQQHLELRVRAMRLIAEAG